MRCIGKGIGVVMAMGTDMGLIMVKATIKATNTINISTSSYRGQCPAQATRLTSVKPAQAY